LRRHISKIGGRKGPGSFAGVLSFPSFGVSGLSGLLIAISIFFLLLSALRPQVLTSVRVGTADAFAPVLRVVSMPLQKSAVFVRDITGLAAIQAENARLVEENIKLKEWYQTALLLEAENKSLRELMNLKVDPQNTYITARILSDSNTNFVKSLLVSAGSDAGVEKGQAVIAGGGLIGRVVEVGVKTSRVLLLTDMNSRVPVIIEGSRQHAIFAGKNKRNGVLVHMPPDSEVKTGARIVTSGLGGIFPTGLPVGVIQSIDSAINVQPFADFNRLMHVRIISKQVDPNLRPGVLESVNP